MPAYTFPFDCLKQALPPDLFRPAISYRDAFSPFTIDAALGEFLIGGDRAGKSAEVRVTIGSGMLRDADKGAFPLAGLELAMRAAGPMEPAGVVNPGALSELQQVGLLDTVATYLNGPGIEYAIGGMEIATGAVLAGLLAVVRRDARAAFVIPGGLFVEQAVKPAMAAAPAAGGGERNPGRLTWTVRMAADKLVIAPEAAPSIACSHGLQYDADRRTLLFVPEPGEQQRLAAATDPRVQALAQTAATGLSLRIARFPAGRSVSGNFYPRSAGLCGAVYLEGNWT